MNRLEGKVAVLTAAGNGIGRATALAFAGEGAQVLATDVDLAALESLKRCEPGIEVGELDIRDTGAVRALAAAAPTPDILFNCAGFVHHGTIEDISEPDWDFSFDLNVKSMWRTITAFLPKMVAAGGGCIINMASVASSISATPNRCVYSATKGAILGLSKSIAADYADKAIRCNCICPGTVDTPSLRERMRAHPDGYEAAREGFIARQPLGRIARAEEIAHLAVWLASDEASFVTGSAQIIDGGWSM